MRRGRAVPFVFTYLQTLLTEIRDGLSVCNPTRIHRNKSDYCMNGSLPPKAMMTVVDFIIVLIQARQNKRKQKSTTSTSMQVIVWEMLQHNISLQSAKRIGREKHILDWSIDIMWQVKAIGDLISCDGHSICHELLKVKIAAVKFRDTRDARRVELRYG